MCADSTSAGKLHHEYTSVSINFATNAMGDIESLELVARRVGVGALTNTLSRSGSSDTFTNAQTTVTFSVSVETTVAAGDPLPFTLTDSTLGLSAEPLTVQPGTEPLAYQTFDAPTSALPEGLDNPGYGAFWGWQFYVNGPPTVISQSEGGKIRVHYVRWEGPEGILAEHAQRSPQHFKLMSDGNYYAASQNPAHPLACECGCVTPEAHILVATSQRRELPQNFTLTDVGLQHLGFVAGAFAQAVDDAKGVLDFVIMDFQLARKRDRFLKAYISMETGNATAPQLELLVDVGTKAEEVSAFIEGVWDLWLAAEQNRWDQMRAAASGDWEEYNRQSETMRWLSAYMVEFMVAVQNEYDELNSFERGKIQGRITLEAVLIVLPFTKPAQAGHLSKVQFLTRLSEVGWIRENEQLLNILTRVIQLVEGKTPVPPLSGIPAHGIPPLLSGTELGGAGTRASGALTVKIMQAGSATSVRRAKFMEVALEELPNAGERNIAARIRTYQTAIVDETDAIPTADQYADVLRYADFDQLKTQKRITHVLVADAEDVDLWIRLEGYLPQDWLVGHHWPPKYIQKRFRELGVDIPDLDDCPVQILTEFEHGKGGASSAIHRLMNGGAFPEDASKLRLLYDTPEELMDELLKFVKNHPDNEVKAFVKPLRGWAQEHNIPFSQ